ncbi:hypothetical protein D9M72_473710 [compost metagenome]
MPVPDAKHRRRDTVGKNHATGHQQQFAGGRHDRIDPEYTPQDTADEEFHEPVEKTEPERRAPHATDIGAFVH